MSHPPVHHASAARGSVFDPNDGVPFEKWFHQHEDMFNRESEDKKVSSLLESLNEYSYKRFCSAIFPKKPEKLTFDDVVETLKVVFNLQTIRNERYLEAQVNSACDAFDHTKLTKEQFKAMVLGIVTEEIRRFDRTTTVDPMVIAGTSEAINVGGETYKRSGNWRGRLGQLVGDGYQCLFLKYVWLIAVSSGLFKDFRLAMEMKIAGKFDDLCIRWTDSGVRKIGSLCR
uniref:(northern house mosquito) hypothetical protein n=1 Tax=Culex pipiens TaxID=7175 RepID=A0A8D8DLC7_CULPI